MASVMQKYYLDAALKMLPPGLAWNRAPDSYLAQLLACRCDSLETHNQTGHQLINERLPRNAFLLLDGWESFFGLPECGTEISTIESRRAALTAKDNEVGSFNKHYLQDIARKNGYEINIVAHHPHHCRRDCVYPLHPPENAWRVFIYTTSKSIRNATCLDDITNELVMIERSKIECYLQRFCYSHLEMVFVYEEE
jgi:uncharacterized protein YmfQ (DUF2313 family)